LRLTPARKWALSLLLLGLLLALFYSDRVFSAGIYEGGDTLEHDIPLAAFFARSIRAGSFPLYNRYQLRTSSEKAGLLFLSEAHSRWWEARVDNEAAPVLSPFGLFLGLRIPAGDHTITFTYRPWPVYGCWIVSLGALLGVLTWAGLRLRSLRRKKL